MAVLHKADFIYENITQRHRLFRAFFKRGKEITLSFITLLIINHHQPCTCSSKAPPRITLEEVNLAFLNGTSSTQFLIIPFKLFYDLIVLSQVVRNRGHGFSKRFNPAGVHCVYLRYCPAHCLRLALFRGKPAEWERLQPLPC